MNFTNDDALDAAKYGLFGAKAVDWNNVGTSYPEGTSYNIYQTPWMEYNAFTWYQYQQNLIPLPVSHYDPLVLPDQPRVILVKEGFKFHLVDHHHRLMCTGKGNTLLKFENLSNNDCYTAINHFQQYFCSNCAQDLAKYKEASDGE